MSRPQLIKKLKEKNPKINHSELEIVIDTFCDTIVKALVEGRNIEIRSFGSFLVKKTKENYYARNPKTGELIYVPEKNKVRFKASKNLKRLIND
ncbi:integration host factor subunit beta [Candidatus Pelagibacter bacterium]|nr:integration host factor subunit beta [Candidatus Pelagibacter bacterium]